MKKWIGIVLIGIMFLSSIAIAVIQSVTFGGVAPAQSQQQAQVTLPSEPIIEQRMTSDQFAEAISRGFTVATYKYDRTCVECAEERRLVEQIVLSKDFQGQIILEEVRQPGNSSLDVASAYGEKTVGKIDFNSTIDAFCELAVSPPLGCAAREIGGLRPAP